MKLSLSVRKRLFLVVLALLPAVIASAKNIRVTVTNLSRFSAVGSKGTYFCYENNRGTKLLGVANSRSLNPGVIWKQRDSAIIKKEIAALNREIRKSQRSRFPDRSAIKRLKLRRKGLERSLKTVGPLEAECSSVRGPEFLGNINSLAPYRELLTANEARHFLDKVAFGGSPQLLSELQTQGLSYVVNKLLNTPPSAQVQDDALFWAAPQLGTDDETGEKLWHTYPLQFHAVYESLFTDNPFQLRMALLFWHPHYATNLSRLDLGFSRWTHLAIPKHYILLRKEVVGNAITLAKEMVADEAMSRWLNNEDNHRGAPNQNFARELMELFLLGTVDPITRVPNYDERSIPAATAFMSGFYQDWDSGQRKILYSDFLKDNSPYTVFPGLEAEATASFSASTFIDHIAFNHPGAARYLGERLFAQLVTPDVPADVVRELAADLIAEGYELKPVLAKILRSEAMFSTAARNRCLRSPADLVLTVARRLITTPLSKSPERIENGQWLLWLLNDAMQRAGQSLFEPPSVFGWKGACGLNRDGKRYYGDGFITEQNLLNRTNAVIAIVNYLAAMEYNFRSLLPAGRPTARDAVIHIAHNIFGVELTEPQILALSHFLTHDQVGPDEVTPIEFNVDNNVTMQRKLPALIVLIFDTIEAQTV